MLVNTSGKRKLKQFNITPYSQKTKKLLGASEMAKSWYLPHKPSNLRFIPRIHVKVKGEKHRVALRPSQIHCGICMPLTHPMHTYTHTHTEQEIQFKLNF